MKILFFTNEHKNLPGAQRCYIISRELQKIGIQSDIINTVDFLGYNQSLLNKTINDVDKIKTQIKIYNKIKNEKGAILYLQRIDYHIIAPLFLKKVYGNQLILDIDDWALDANFFHGLSFFRSFKMNNMFKRVASLSDACVTIGFRLKKLLELYNNNVICIPPLVSTHDLFIKGKNNEFIFSWIGTIFRDDDLENIKFVINAFKLFCQKIKQPNVYLDIVGGGPLSDKLNIFKDENQIRIKNWLNKKELENYLKNIDVGLIPLVNNSNYNIYKSPTKFFDFMSFGKPVIVSNIGEINDLVLQIQNGFRLENSLRSWSVAMSSLYKHTKEKEQLGLNGYRATQREFGLSESINKIHGLLRNL